MTLLRYNVDKPESSYAQIRLFARKNEDEKFQQVVCWNYEFEVFIYLHDVMNSVDKKVMIRQPICNVFQKIFSSVYFFSYLFYSSQVELEHWR